MSDDAKPIELEEIIRYFERMRDDATGHFGLVPVFRKGLDNTKAAEFAAGAIATLTPLSKKRLDVYSVRGFHGASD
jgi:hypothetical protein